MSVSDPYTKKASLSDMKISDRLLNRFEIDRQEQELQGLLELKGYRAPNANDFGLNTWTRLLAPYDSPHDEERSLADRPAPDNLVSFLIIPENRHAELIETNSIELRTWISAYEWASVPGVQPPLQQVNLQACSEGLLFPQWLHGSKNTLLEAFLLVRRDGALEFGFGRDSYNLFNGNTIFGLIQIVGKLWQLLIFSVAFHSKFAPDTGAVLCFINVRGTEDSLMGNLAEGWPDPFSRLPLRLPLPKCYEKNLQIQKKINYSSLVNDLNETVRWFATRIENGWGQFAPRCYVHEKLDETQPFAYSARR